MTGLIITLAQQKGGAGKTTVAAHLAVACALGGKSVAVLDTDRRAVSASGSSGGRRRWGMRRSISSSGPRAVGARAGKPAPRPRTTMS